MNHRKRRLESQRQEPFRVMNRDEFVSVEELQRGAVPVVLKGFIDGWPARAWSPMSIAASKVWLWLD
jgi:hypothetical protein